MCLGLCNNFGEEEIAIIPQVPSVWLFMCLGLQIYTINWQIAHLLQAELSKKETQVANLQDNIKTQQAETSKAKEELTNTLAAMEKLKENFKSERVGWDTEKATLLKRAEDAEVALSSVVEELTGLKWQISSMTTTVFGE